MEAESYERQLDAEAESWLIADPVRRAEKIEREVIRHPKLIRDLLLDRLGTHRMDVLEVGGGPAPVSDQLEFRTRLVIDPLTLNYRVYWPCPDHLDLKAEDLDLAQRFDLAICTNALDHVEDPEVAVRKMNRALRPGGYMAVMCAENNALTNPHPAHALNLTARDLHRWLDEQYETVWELTFRDHGYRYGWVEYEGRVGQPAFAMLMRKVVGYR